MNKVYCTLIIFLGFLILSCSGDATISPKPRTYPKLELPVLGTQEWSRDECPFTWLLPKDIEVNKKETFFDEESPSDCWMDLTFPYTEATLHVSYMPIFSENEYYTLREDAFDLVDKHTIRATYIDRYPIELDNGSSGFIFHIEGPVASPLQFFITDTMHHFLRGALYFQTAYQKDSLEPVLNYHYSQINEAIQSIQWQNDSK